MNRDAQTCTIVSTVDEKKLVDYIRKKLHKQGEIVPPKQEKKEEEKKKEEVKEIKEAKVEVAEKKEEVKNIVVPYFVHCTHAPQRFSDENPDACSVMWSDPDNYACMYSHNLYIHKFI